MKLTMETLRKAKAMLDECTVPPSDPMMKLYYDEQCDVVYCEQWAMARDVFEKEFPQVAKGMFE